MTLDTSAFSPPRGFLDVANQLEQAGFTAWAVGGAVRDACVCEVSIGSYRKSPDWDLATQARPDEVVALFSRTVPVGVEHGTVGVLLGDDLYEVTTFRRDVETDGRHARVTFGDSIEEDLARRDFTINAMAWRPRTGDVCDPFNGVADFEAGVLRAVGTPAHRFTEDYLRVLRGIRFAGRFSLELEAETANALGEGVVGLPRLSAERVREELMKVLTDPVPSCALNLYMTFGVLLHWYRELVHATADHETWLATLGAVDAVSPRRPLVRLARWLAQTGQDATERKAASTSLLGRLKFSNADQRGTTNLVGHYLPFVDPLDSSAVRRRWLSGTGDGWRDVIRLHAADARSAQSERTKRDILTIWRGLHGEKLRNPPLQIQDLAITGDDILELGVLPGPVVGILLERLLEKVLEDPAQNARDPLLAATHQLIEVEVAPESLLPDA